MAVRTRLNRASVPWITAIALGAACAVRFRSPDPSPAHRAAAAGEATTDARVLALFRDAAPPLDDASTTVLADRIAAGLPAAIWTARRLRVADARVIDALFTVLEDAKAEILLRGAAALALGELAPDDPTPRLTRLRATAPPLLRPFLDRARS